MRTEEYQSAGRILKLLIFLLKDQQGRERSEIYQAVPGYNDAPTIAAGRRRFERDLHQLEQVGFRVVRTRRAGQAYLYTVYL